MVNSSILYDEWKQLQDKFPLLQELTSENTKSCIEGVLPVTDRDGNTWASFKVRIDIQNDYPESLPSITDVEGIIPRSADWHINADQTCCVGTLAEQHQKLGGRISLLNWVSEFAVPYFANFIYRKEKGKYYNGEWSHGAQGIFEYYFQLFGISNIHLLLDRLYLVCGVKKYNLNGRCFCNSGKKYKRCYILNPDQHRFNIPEKVILHDILKLKGLR